MAISTSTGRTGASDGTGRDGEGSAPRLTFTELRTRSRQPVSWVSPSVDMPDAPAVRSISRRSPTSSIPGGPPPSGGGDTTTRSISARAASRASALSSPFIASRSCATRSRYILPRSGCRCGRCEGSASTCWRNSSRRPSSSTSLAATAPPRDAPSARASTRFAIFRSTCASSVRLPAPAAVSAWAHRFHSSMNASAKAFARVGSMSRVPSAASTCPSSRARRTRELFRQTPRRTPRQAR